MSLRLTHTDCENFVALDATKGVCQLSDQSILIDSQTCDYFEQIPKCRACKFFSKDANTELGTCIGREKPYWVDGNYRAELCSEFKLR